MREMGWVLVAHACHPSTLEAEIRRIRRIAVRSQPRQIVHKALS
jgi:hypothetical protein